MLLQALFEATSRTPQKVAVQDFSRQLTFAQLTTFAAAMRRLILRETHAQRVGVMLPASAACTGTLYGLLWAGRTAVPLNFLLQPAELRSIIADAGLDLVLSITHFKSLLEQLPVRSLCLEELGLKRRYIIEKFRRTPDPPAIAADDVAAIIYTSGTTGQPKGVCLTYRNFAFNCQAAAEQLQLTADEHLLGIIPPFHAFGLSILNYLPAILDATVTFVPRFSPHAVYETVARGEVTLLVAVPSMYSAIARLKNIEHAAFRSVKLAVSGAEPLRGPVYDLFLERTGIRLTEGYGMTEASPVISVDLPWAHRRGTVGPPLPGVQLQLRDPSGGVLAEYCRPSVRQGGNGTPSPHIQPPAQPVEGELYIRGPLVMKGYYQRPEETAAVLAPDGWFRTGDLVRLDPHGYLTITGRVKDLIIVAGENVLPREVENVLEQHPAVAESSVVGQPDPSRGEVPIAFVTLREGAEASPEELREFCRERLAGYKTPREVLILPEFPRGPTGKVVKQQLRAQLPVTSEITTEAQRR